MAIDLFGIKVSPPFTLPDKVNGGRFGGVIQ